MNIGYHITFVKSEPSELFERNIERILTQEYSERQSESGVAMDTCTGIQLGRKTQELCAYQRSPLSKYPYK